jgi:hypothetical protein
MLPNDGEKKNSPTASFPAAQETNTSGIPDGEDYLLVFAQSPGRYRVDIDDNSLWCYSRAI